VTRADTLGAGGSLRLFLALLLPHHAETAIARWSDEHLRGGRRPESLHVTLAFLGRQPQGALGGIVDALRECAADRRPFILAPARYRETRSVGMLVLDDPSGEATRLASELQRRLEELGLYRMEARPWLPHVTVLRFRERPRLAPPLAPLQAELEGFAPSEAAAFVSRLHRTGARHEVLERCALGG
jgi:2'-5' RNA ligase